MIFTSHGKRSDKLASLASEASALHAELAILTAAQAMRHFVASPVADLFSGRFIDTPARFQVNGSPKWHCPFSSAIQSRVFRPRRRNTVPVGHRRYHLSATGNQKRLPPWLNQPVGTSISGFTGIVVLLLADEFSVFSYRRGNGI